MLSNVSHSFKTYIHYEYVDTCTLTKKEVIGTPYSVYNYRLNPGHNIFLYYIIMYMLFAFDQ